MSYDHVIYEKRDHVAYVTLNRPERMNALDAHSHAELIEIFDDFAADDDAWVAIITGAGDRAFCAGNDLKATAAAAANGRRHAGPGARFAAITRGYDNDLAATNAAFRDGWFRTGDLGYLDRDGYLFIVGRIKDVINRGGQKISPLEVEEVLLSHPAVLEAGVFAVPHEKPFGHQIVHEDSSTCRRVRHAFVQPVDRGLIGKLALVADEGTVARPNQAIGARDANKLTCVIYGLRAKPIAA